jgi:hypothetical protein
MAADGIGKGHDMSRSALDLAEAGVAGLSIFSPIGLTRLLGRKISMRGQDHCRGRKK